jgi:prolyl oligopeptidase
MAMFRAAHPHRPARRLLLAPAFALALTSACSRPAWPPPPETRREVVTDTLHGVTFEDPYRWLEDQSANEVRAWIAAQNAYADSIVGHTPLRARLDIRLRELIDVPETGAPRRAGDWEYFTLRRSGEEGASVYRRKPPAVPSPIDPAGDYQKVLDPLSLDPQGTISLAIEGFSGDGSLMLYALRDGGRDEVSIRVFDLTRLAHRPDSLPPGLYSSLAFDRDGNGFYYSRRSRIDGARIRYHRLGTGVERDSTLFGRGYAPTAFISMTLADGGRWRIYNVQHGWRRNEIFLQDAAAAATPVPVTADLDAHFTPQFLDGALWMRTDLDAPRGRIVSVDPARPARENWKEIIPQADDVLDSFAQIDGKLYVTWIHDVSHRITIHTMDGQPAGELALPEHTSASLRGAGPGQALLTLTSFAQPAITYRIDLATGARELWEKAEVPFDSTGIEVKQVWYTSKDGTRAPMYVMHRRGLALDGQAPALLTGYGGFNLSLMPRFDARAAAWVEQGGVFAQATLRGGGEYGETWHRAGWLENKQHVFDDFIASAEWLVANGYTRADRLAIRGGSNGGLLMGAAITQRPDLFRAAFVGVPDLDMLRFWSFIRNNNLPALLEYGDASKPEQFAPIRAFSPYQNVRDGTRYPAVMVHTGDLDTRVPPLQGRKFTARLQAATRSGLPVILHYDERMGHAGGRGTSHIVRDAAMELAFLLRQLGADTTATPR